MNMPKDRAELVAMIARSAFPSGWLPPIGDDEARTAEYRRAQAVAHTKAAVAAIEAAGLRIVPVTLTTEMFNATQISSPVWGAWLAASPYAPKE